MNQILLGSRLAAISPSTLQRFQNENLIHSLEHDPSTKFAASKILAESVTPSGQTYAHQAGCTTLATSECGRYLASGGADASIRFWDLSSSHGDVHIPAASLTRGNTDAHRNSTTSLSIYPFDPTPSTLLSTSFDKTLLLTQITPTSLQPLHSFQLDYAPYCHGISPIPSPQPLIAVGTAHPAIRLLDLRSGHSTHSLPGHNGSIYTLTWSPKHTHVLVSGATDGRVLFFDVRRANAAYASLHLDDATGLTSSHTITSPSQLLNFNSLAHNGPVTSVQFTTSASAGGVGDRLVTTGHDQRIRVWNTANGRNELVHFGPRIRNERQGQLAPLLSPAGYATRPSREALFWPNDDARGAIHMYSLLEGQLLRVLRTEGVKRNNEFGKESGGSNGKKLVGKGRINQIVWRQGEAVEGVQMVSAHGDGSLGVWRSWDGEDGEGELGEGGEGGEEGQIDVVDGGEDVTISREIEEAENKRKRKREVLESLVMGLSKKAAT